MSKYRRGKRSTQRQNKNSSYSAKGKTKEIKFSEGIALDGKQEQELLSYQSLYKLSMTNLHAASNAKLLKLALEKNIYNKDEKIKLFTNFLTGLNRNEIKKYSKDFSQYFTVLRVCSQKGQNFIQVKFAWDGEQGYSIPLIEKQIGIEDYINTQAQIPNIIKFLVSKDNAYIASQLFKYHIYNYSKDIEHITNFDKIAKFQIDQAKRVYVLNAQKLFQIVALTPSTSSYQDVFAKFISSLPFSPTFKIEALNIVANFMLEVDEFKAAYSLLKSFKHKVQKDSIHYYNYLYNLAVTCMNLDKFIEAIKLFKQYEELAESDIELVEHLYRAYVCTGQDKLASEYLNRHSKDIAHIILVSNMKELPTEETASICKKFADQDGKLPAIAEAVLSISVLDKLVKSSNMKAAMFQTCINNLEKYSLKPLKLAYLCFRYNFDEVAHDYLKNIPPVHDKMVGTLSYEMKIQACSKKMLLKNEISNSKLSEADKISLLKKYSLKLLEYKKFDLAKEVCDEILDIDQTHSDAVILGAYSLQQLGQTDPLYTKLLREYRAKQSSEKENKIEQHDFEEDKDCEEEERTEGPIEELCEEDNLYANLDFDPKLIHEHFQAVKAQLLTQETNITKTHDWHLKSGVVDISQTTEASDIYGFKYYTHISDSLRVKLASRGGKLLERFENALKKGITYQMYTKNGIKVLQKKLIELKIDGDERLYTDTIHVNDNTGDQLIEFDHLGNHTDVSNKLAGSSGITYDHDCIG